MAHTPDIRRRSDRPDRRMEDVIVRAQPNAGAGVLTRSLPSGTIIEAFPKRQQSPENNHPWKITLGTDEPWTIKVRTGMLVLGSGYHLPMINNVSMANDPAPTLSVPTGKHKVCLAFRATADMLSSNANAVTIYYLSRGKLVTSSMPAILLVPESQSLGPNEQTAMIDYHTGNITPGLYYVALGMVERTTGQEAALKVTSQFWKTNVRAFMLGDGAMDYAQT